MSIALDQIDLPSKIHAMILQLAEMEEVIGQQRVVPSIEQQTIRLRPGERERPCAV